MVTRPSSFQRSRIIGNRRGCKVWSLLDLVEPGVSYGRIGFLNRLIGKIRNIKGMGDFMRDKVRSIIFYMLYDIAVIVYNFLMEI